MFEFFLGKYVFSLIFSKQLAATFLRNITGCPSNSGTRLMECVRTPAGQLAREGVRSRIDGVFRYRRLRPRGCPRCHPGPQSEERNSNLTAGAWSQSPATDRLSPPGWSNTSRICRTAPASPGSGRSAGLRFLRSTSPCLSQYSPTSRPPGVEPARSVSRTRLRTGPPLSRVAFSLSPQPTRREQKPTGERRMATASDDSSRRRLTSRSVGVRA